MREPQDDDMHESPSRSATGLAERLFWSHALLAVILLAAVGITLWGLVEMNAAISEIKNEYMADFEEEELLHRSAWTVETFARHGALSCERPEEVAAQIAQASRELGALLQRHARQVSPAMARAALGYQHFGEHVSERDVCERLRDRRLDRERLALDEELTNSWIGKLRELRIAITEKEVAAQRLGSRATAAGLALGALALLAAGLIARSVARGVTVPLALIAQHARRLGEGDSVALPSFSEPREVAQLSSELERMRSRLAEVNQLKQAFLGSVSHELRTPLAHMREALSLLIDGTVGALSAKQHRVAALALRACEREIRLVSALLDWTRIRSGKPLQRLEGQRIDDIIASALANVHETAQRAQVTIKRDGDSPMPQLSMDAVLVETALVNVLNNAIAASPSGGEVRIRREVSSPDGRGAPHLRVVVEDDGKGVLESLRSQIFEPFFTTKTGSESTGSGLGLPLAREMMRAHGGDLLLLPSAPERGAAFALTLPLADTEQAASGSPQADGFYERSHE